MSVPKYQARVLVIQREDSLQRLLAKQLDGLVGEANVDATADYGSAVLLYDRNKHDIVISAGLLVGGHGINLLREIQRKKGSYDGLYIYTSSPDIVDDARELGIRAYDKSESPALLADIDRYLDGLRKASSVTGADSQATESGPAEQA